MSADIGAGKTREVYLRDAWYVPDLKMNLLSADRAQSLGAEVRLTQEGATVTDSAGELICVGERRGNATWIKAVEICAGAHDAHAFGAVGAAHAAQNVRKAESMDVWHKRSDTSAKGPSRVCRRMCARAGHPGRARGRCAHCEPCVVAKHARSPFPSGQAHATAPWSSSIAM